MLPITAASRAIECLFEGDPMNPSIQQNASEPRRKLRVIRLLSWAALGWVTAFLLLLFGVSERWWLGAVATYSPRIAVLAPSLVLLPIALFLDRRSAYLNGVAIFMVAVFAMEFHLPKPFRSSAEGSKVGGFSLRIVSGNVDSFGPDFETFLNEIKGTEPDLIALQEAPAGRAPLALKDAYSDWQIVTSTEFWVASRFPAQILDRCHTTDFNRDAAVAVEIDTPAGTMVLVDVHTRTARFGIYELQPAKVFSREGSKAIAKMEDIQARRHSELAAVREFVDRISRERATIVAGDFNTPESSSAFPEFSGGFTNAFTASGWGYGHTAPCDRTGPLPAGHPWIRVDHILVNRSWDIVSCRTGTGNGSDHRLVMAEVRLKEPAR